MVLVGEVDPWLQPTRAARERKREKTETQASVASSSEPNATSIAHLVGAASLARVGILGAVVLASMAAAVAVVVATTAGEAARVVVLGRGSDGTEVRLLGEMGHAEAA